MSERFIPLHAPVISNQESIYVKDCLKTSGYLLRECKYVELFEEEVKNLQIQSMQLLVSTGPQLSIFL